MALIHLVNLEGKIYSCGGRTLSRRSVTCPCIPTCPGTLSLCKYEYWTKMV